MKWYQMHHHLRRYYQGFFVRDTKQYRITGGKNSIDVTKDSLDDMVKYVKENNLLDYVSSEQTIE